MALATTESYTVRAGEIDVNRQLTIPALISIMQNTAWNNAAQLDASVYQLQEIGITWVMNRMKLTILKLPRHEEQLFIETWPSGSHRNFIYRDYRVYDRNQMPIALATSTWLVLDIEERKMTYLPDHFMPRTLAPGGYIPLPRAGGKLSFPESHMLGEKRFAVRWHELDPNGHVASSLYFQWALETLPQEILLNGNIREIDLLFRSEAGYGDSVMSRIAQLGDRSFAHEIVNVADKRLMAQVKTVVDYSPET